MVGPTSEELGGGGSRLELGNFLGFAAYGGGSYTDNTQIHRYTDTEYITVFSAPHPGNYSTGLGACLLVITLPDRY